VDDQTTRLLYAASRGDTATISLICESSFDPNHGDYDNRTALMVASMKGNTEVCRLLLNFKVCKLFNSFVMQYFSCHLIKMHILPSSLIDRLTPTWKICTDRLLVSSFLFIMD